MEVYNVKRIFDNDEFISVETSCGALHLPKDSYPSITITEIHMNGKISVHIDFETN